MKVRKAFDGDDFVLPDNISSFDDRLDFFPDQISEKNKNNVDNYPQDYQNDLFPSEIPRENMESMNIDGDTMKWMMNPDEELDHIELKLAGYYLDRQKQIFKRIPRESRMINDRGISNIMAVARSIITKNSSQGYLTDIEVKYIVYEMCESITRDLAVNGRKNYSCDPSNFRKIVNMIDNAIYTFMSRAINGNERSRFGNKPLNTLGPDGNIPWWKKIKNMW